MSRAGISRLFPLAHLAQSISLGGPTQGKKGIQLNGFTKEGVDSFAGNPVGGSGRSEGQGFVVQVEGPEAFGPPSPDSSLFDGGR
ncbi:MAG: hypothetical protein PVJ76_19335, partial [Gemmatimonadota bacterium]